MVACTAISAGAAAQTRDKAMQGLTSVHLVIEDINHLADACGVTKQALDDRFRLEMVGKPVSVILKDAVKPDSNAPTLYLKASVLPIDIPHVANGPCVTYLSIRLYSYQKVPLLPTGRDAFASVEIWEKTTMLASAKEIHGKSVVDAVAEKANEFVAAWRLDNSGPPAQ